MPDCPFCQRIAAGQYDHDDHLGSVAFPPLDPVTPGHMLIVPRKHIQNALDGPKAPYALEIAMRHAAVLAQELGIKACNLIASAGPEATQSVYHLHVHLLPRRAGDGLLLPWGGQHARYRKEARNA